MRRSCSACQKPRAGFGADENLISTASRSSAVLDDEIDLGADGRAVEAQSCIGGQLRRHLLDHETFPRRADHRVALQVAHRGQAQQSVQQAAVA